MKRASWQTAEGSDSTDGGAGDVAKAVAQLMGNETYDELKAQFEAWESEQD